MKKLFSALLAGAMLLAMGLSLAACGGHKAFYTLKEAYEREIISYSDVEAMYCIYKIPNHLVLTVQEEEVIKQSFFDNFDVILKEEDVTPRELNSVEDVEITGFFGDYHGNYIVGISWFDDPTGSMRREIVANCLFYVSNDTYLFVWTNPEQIDLSLYQDMR